MINIDFIEDKEMLQPCRLHYFEVVFFFLIAISNGQWSLNRCENEKANFVQAVMYEPIGVSVLVRLHICVYACLFANGCAHLLNAVMASKFH